MFFLPFRRRLFAERTKPLAFMASPDGGVSLIFALAAPVMLAAGWLAMNYAFMTAQHAELRAAADSAALSAAKQLSLSNVTSATIQQAAATQAQANLHANPYLAAPDVISSSVDSSHAAVTVTVTRQLTPMLSTSFGITSSTVSATSTAQYRSSPVCVLILDPSSSGAFNAFGNSNLTAPGCAIVSNSNSTSGLSGRTNGAIQSSKACSAGGYDGNAFNPTPISDCPVMADPLATRSAPPNVGAACDYVDFSFSSSSMPLQPGVYCGGISIKKGTAVFDPGDYIVRGGGLTINAGGSIEGSDVGIYLTGGAVLDGQPNSGISLTAPSDPTDPMVGLVFWEDPNNEPASSPATHKIWSDNAQNLHGTVYFPQGTLNIGGKAEVGGAADYTIIVAYDLVAFQSANIILNTNYSSSKIPVPPGIGNTGGSLHLSQ